MPVYRSLVAYLFSRTGRYRWIDDKLAADAARASWAGWGGNKTALPGLGYLRHAIAL